MKRLTNIVILAGGKGTRMYSAQPKVLHRLGGKPLLHHVVATARALAAERIIIVDGFGSAAVRASLTGEPVRFAHQAEQLGTGHALMQALPEMLPQGHTLVLFGDVPLVQAATLQALLDATAAGEVGLLTACPADATGYGRVVRSPQGAVVRIVEHKDATDQERTIREVNTGIMVLPSERLTAWLGALANDNAQGEYYLTDVIAAAVAAGVPVQAHTVADPLEVEGINSKVQLAAQERYYQQRQAHRLLEQGVTLADPARLDVRGEILVGKDVEIDVNCIFEGRVVLGDNVRVGAQVILRDVVIAAGTEILPYTVVEGSEAQEGCRIGPFARVRPGTQLGREVHIGDFVELKNARIGDNSKINHMSYVGDSIVGRNVNIGAGTITCNYDGANKHQTIIGDNVFVGSDTQLVAPVTVEEGATIGAGTTVTKRVPAGSLTLSRSKQISLANWQRPKKN